MNSLLIDRTWCLHLLHLILNIYCCETADNIGNNLIALCCAASSPGGISCTNITDTESLGGGSLECFKIRFHLFMGGCTKGHKTLNTSEFGFTK